MEIPLLPGKGFIREYEQSNTGGLRLIKETVVNIDMIANLPIDRISGGGAVEIRLTNLLDED
jgi:hypothetical protein